MTLVWILVSGVAMSALALVGIVTLVLREATLQRMLLPLVAFAAGAMIGGALFHVMPASLEALTASSTFVWVAIGFSTFLVIEQVLHWHHCHRDSCKKPMTYLVLVGDGLHNFLDGAAIAGAFLVDLRLGFVTWLAAAAHEVPQELGDFAVLIHGGWTKRSALLFNLLSGLTFVVGGVITYAASQRMATSWLLPFAAGNFLYLGASDLVPEVIGARTLRDVGVRTAMFLAGLGALYAITLVE